MTGDTYKHITTGAMVSITAVIDGWVHYTRHAENPGDFSKPVYVFTQMYRKVMN